MAQHVAITLSPKAKKVAWVVGIGGGLFGAVLIYHEAKKYLVRKKLQELARKAINGEVPTADFLNAVVSSGPEIAPGTPRVTVADAARMQCSRVFPFTPPIEVVHQMGFESWDQALETLRRQGTCL